MNRTIHFLFAIFVSINCFGQKISLEQGKGFEQLGIGDTYESAQETLGFGKLKSYEKYLADELFDRSPDEALECLIGFDSYVKYEYLVTLPVLYVFFKDNRIVQIKSTSFPEYYHPIAEDVEINDGIKFWTGADQLAASMGKEDIMLREDYLILETYVYLSKGISFSTREKQLRIVHVFEPVQGDGKEEIMNALLP